MFQVCIVPKHSENDETSVVEAKISNSHTSSVIDHQVAGLEFNISTLPKKVACIYHVLKRKIVELSKEVQKLRIVVAMQANDVELEQDLHSDLRGIMNKMTEKVHEGFEHPDGFRYIFLWDRQLAALETNNPK